jgi:hypothetical protein
VIYDVTNTHLYGKKCPLGKLGHDKEGVPGRPLIQIGLGVTQDEGIPIFHKTFDGNIADSKTLQDLITTFGRYQLKSGTIIYDRGITSGRNIVDIKALHWDTICGVPLIETVQRFWRPVIQKSARLRLADRVPLNQTTFYVTARPYAIKKVPGTLYLCFNARQQVDLRDARRAEIVHAQSRLQEGKTIKAGLEKYFDQNRKLISKMLDRAEEFDGYSCIFSIRPLAKDQLVRLYFDKDLVEKAFRSLKGVVRLQPIRHWLSQRVVAHVFICYLAYPYLLLSLLKFRLQSLDISPEAALDELNTMYKVYLKDPSTGSKSLAWSLSPRDKRLSSKPLTGKRRKTDVVSIFGMEFRRILKLFQQCARVSRIAPTICPQRRNSLALSVDLSVRFRAGEGENQKHKDNVSSHDNHERIPALWLISWRRIPLSGC